mgnify:CR=1 FL=1
MLDCDDLVGPSAVVTREAQQYSVIASYVHAISSALDSRGVDARAVFREAGVEFQASPDPLARLRNEEVSRLFEVATRTTGDCLLYTSDAADERSSVDLGGRRIIKKKNNKRSVAIDEHI